MRFSIRRSRTTGQWVIWRRRHYVVLTRIPARVQYGETFPAEWEVEHTTPRHHTSLYYRETLWAALRLIHQRTRKVATR